MGSDYRFLTVWRVAGSVDEGKAVLGDAASLPRWWPSVYLNVAPVDDGAPDGTGRVVDLYTKGWLPYTLRWALTITEPMSDTGFALTRGARPQRNGSVDLHPGRTRSGDQVRLAGQRRQTPLAPVELAVQAGVLGQSPLGHGPWRGKSATGAAPSQGRRSRPGKRTGATAATTDVRVAAPPTPPWVPAVGRLIVDRTLSTPALPVWPVPGARV